MSAPVPAPRPREGRRGPLSVYTYARDTPENVRRAAALHVADRAHSPQDARQLLAMLGLTPTT
ncbi:hypothetical protein [Streptomyces sp. SID11385]|uniref:hypothetical protein n=1 Tax=Streptomyces sp. SID11385 TaxID=2706031 RepID=UPI0013C7E71E|nr:hypothetical protein [Streptomyces sp. SID11385]NEA40909.1 hypothetical protein [Streptomyces sp. SID11385]